ncbi:serine protease [Pseudomonas protegens]|uniref:S1 family peptidase n=1 Tax=Pseudomonas protegens TaxID=380021 RepID=UPI00320806D0
MTHTVQITQNNPVLELLKLSWGRAEFTAVDGMGPMTSLYEAGDSLVAVAKMGDEGITIIGSGVMVAPGLLLSATHVLDEFDSDSPPVFLTFLPEGGRAWLCRETSTVSGEVEFAPERRKVSDISLVSCTLNSEAHEQRPLMLGPMQVALPKLGDRLWAYGYRHQFIDDGAASVTPMISSGLVTQVYPQGRGLHLPSPCVEVEMDTLGGMSGGPVVNSDGYVVGIVSTSFDGGPSFITLIWEAMRFNIRSAVPPMSDLVEANLFDAKRFGLARIKGNVNRRPWGDVVLTLDDDENELFLAQSGPDLINQNRLKLSRDRVEEFTDTWGSKMEWAARDAAENYLQSLPLDAVKRCLAIAEIPGKYLNHIKGFSAEDIEGVEDLEVLSAEMKGDQMLGIELYFDLLSVVWTVEIAENIYAQHKLSFDRYFMNIQVDDDVVAMEALQRVYFKASMLFDYEHEEFTDVAVNWSGVRKPRNRKPLLENRAQQDCGGEGLLAHCKG